MSRVPSLSLGCLMGACLTPGLLAVDVERHEAGIVINSMDLPVYTEQTDVWAHYSLRLATPEAHIQPRGLQDHLQGISRLTIDGGWSWRGFDDLIGTESGDGPSGRAEFLYASLSLPLHARLSYGAVLATIDSDQEMSRHTYGGELGMRFGDSLLYGSYSLDQYDYDLVALGVGLSLDYDITETGLHWRWLVSQDDRYHQITSSVQWFEIEADSDSYQWYKAQVAYDYFPGLVGKIGVSLGGIYSRDVSDFDAITAGFRIEAYPAYSAIIQGSVEYVSPFDEATSAGYAATVSWVFTF